MRRTRVKLSQKATFFEVWIEETCLYASVQTFLETKAELLRWICTRIFFFLTLVIDSFMLLLLKWYLLNERSARLRRNIIIIAVYQFVYSRTFTISSTRDLCGVDPNGSWMNLSIKIVSFSDQRWGNLVKLTTAVVWDGKKAVIWWPSLCSTRNGCFGARSFE